MKQPLFPGAVLALAVLAAGPAASLGRESAPSTAGDAPPRLWERVEIVVFGGLGLPAAEGMSLHRAETASPAASPTVENRIRTSSAPAVFTGAAATFFLKNGFGIQAGFGYLKAGLESVGRFSWNPPGSTPASTAVDGGGEGEITSVPFFIGVFKSFEFRFAGKALRAHVAAGPALFFHSILTSSQAGAVAIRDGLTDAILVPVRVEDTTWISPGATAGAGLDLPLSPALSLAVEGRYGFAPRKEFSWIWTPGVYDGIFHRVAAFNFDEAAAAREAGRTTPLSVDPSFFQIAIGLKLIF
ncbi:MAG: hypothetical protein PHF93_01545 [Acidobacteriota bacterium]|nr:hypothetical protein [Acidobacteriota bacterium]MDD8038246.1 hypothetical protein [Acidobacteriota bacterium]